MNVRRSLDNSSFFADSLQEIDGRNLFSEEQFHRMISRERRRTERSHKPFLLMLLDMGDEPIGQNGESSLSKALSVLSSATRETDAVGWYKTRLVVGVMFTEIEAEEKKHILNTMLSRVSAALEDRLSFEQFNQMSLSFHWFPEEWGHGVPKRPRNPVLYPDLGNGGNGQRIAASVKRIMDVVGSICALVLFSPLFFVVALAIKLTSRGPAIFRQERMGQSGKSFTCLKFRTMYDHNDLAKHKEFMKQVIQGKYEGHDGTGAPVYTKMLKDPRITRVGHFLRRSSLDELPQFINVLVGDMALVGPRPPLAYEFQQYQVWHRRRVLEVKPGITGLWQVNGRNRVRFDDQVRLDLKYIRTWTPWLDLQILLRTPKAVLWGNDTF